MKIVCHENKWFSKHIVPHSNTGTFQMSKYVLRLKVNEGHLLYNVLSRALYFFSNEEDETTEFETLIKHWFYVPKDFNELDWVDFLRNKRDRRDSSKPLSIQGYTILTTMDCNARCFYCYEKGRPRISMTEKTASDLADYIIANANGESVDLSWFGGEPLYNNKVIDIICDKLTSSNVEYVSSMISNGLLFSEEIVKRAVEKWKLKRVQITLDGTKEIYLKSKSFVNSDGSEFDKVLDNIELLQNHNIKVTIRLNQDIYNTEDLLQLVDFLKERFPNTKLLSVYNNLLFSKDNQFSKEQEDCYNKLKDQILCSKLSPKSKLINAPKVHSCMADNPKSRVITPDGKIGKCEHYSSENLIGSIYEENVNEEMLAKWSEKIERQEECYTCSLYPICTRIKMCPNERVKCTEFDRNDKLSDLKQAILYTYYEYLEKQ